MTAELGIPRRQWQLAALSGLLLGWSFPPLDQHWLVWIGLVPLLLAIERCDGARQAAALGWIAGFTFFFLVLHPLVSVYSWVGWIHENAVQKVVRLTRQWYFMHFIWLLFSLWSGAFWGVWAALLKRFGRRPLLRLVIAVCAWLLVPERARAAGTFGFEWDFLGNACADWPRIRQIASLGGLSLLSALVVLVNVGFAELAALRRRRIAWAAPAGAALALAATVAWGSAALTVWRASPAPDLDVIVAQYSKPRYAPADYNEIGLLRGYWQMAQEAARRRPRLIVLPESVIKGAMVLDGTQSPTKPSEKQYPVELWATWVAPLLAGSPTGLIIGMDTVEGGRDYNTITGWTAQGLAGRYHKRRRVPFAEYRPWAWGGWAIRGESQYAAGRRDNDIIRLGDVPVGAFICQEVLYGWVMRDAVRDGAQLLMTGANDGVFGNHAVAVVHADLAQLRAVETGRYIIRAAKTGHSAIIDPSGAEFGYTPWKQNLLMSGRVAARTGLTPYVRFGQWVCWLAALLLILALTALPKGSDPLQKLKGV